MVTASVKTCWPLWSLRAPVMDVPDAMSTVQVTDVPVMGGNCLRGAALGWLPGRMERKKGPLPSSVQDNCAGSHTTKLAGVLSVRVVCATATVARVAKTARVFIILWGRKQRASGGGVVFKKL